MTGAPVIDQLAATWASTVRLCDDLGPEEWDRPTDCPGWSVRDQLAHVIGTESALMGRATPPAAGDAAHIKNPMGALNEAWVASFRGRPGREVLAEFRAVTEMRLEALRAMTADELDAEMVGPVGPQPYREFLQIRLMDSWVHEQDIRRAVGRPGHLDGPAAEAALARLVGSLPYVVGKRAGAPDGARVAVHLTGPLGRQLDIEVAGGRARMADAGTAPPTVTLTMSAETYARLASGRLPAQDAISGGQVTIEGERDLGTAVLEHLNVVP
jgi:uncharacterized protein (TIGR03083 family)